MKNFKFKILNKKLNKVINPEDIKDPWLVYTIVMWWLKDNYEILLYVWLKDKNWVDVYEWDIIRLYDIEWVVKYREKMWTFVIEFLDSSFFFWNMSKDFEVISNVYEEKILKIK